MHGEYAKDILPTKASLARRKILEESTSEICKIEAKTTIYALYLYFIGMQQSEGHFGKHDCAEFRTYPQQQPRTQLRVL